MLVSFDWLKRYVPLDFPREEVERRLMMAGLNHESTEAVGDDFCIDLEVTSNRPDCLGHVGVAREAAVLLDQPLTLPPAGPAETDTPVTDLTRVRVDCPQLCPRYTARVIRGVKIGPSPAWLARYLTTLGEAVINNVVDISNFVLLECGQPLHAFDLARLGGREILVREARQGEAFEAINHKCYELERGMCVIADADRPVALGGVMGGADTEVSESTTELLIEAAEFDPVSIRNTARRLNLHSPSSYRFERGIDPQGVDWASRRCCELILEIAGGELAAGVIDVARPLAAREPIVLRLSQLKRILGIDIPAGEVHRILAALGNVEQRADDQRVEVIPPSWRRDLAREIDLVEEVGRIHGYDKIPEDVGVPMAPSTRSDRDRVWAIVRQVLTAAGYDEAMTASAVDEETSAAFSPWTGAEPLRCDTPVLRRADRLRRSLVPSLLAARRTNEALANGVIELFEIANVYLPCAGRLPDEQPTLAVTSGGDFHAVKGVIEALSGRLNPAAQIESCDTAHDLLMEDRCCELRLDGQTLGYLGEVSDAGLKRLGLRGRTTVAEINLSLLERAARLIPQHVDPSPYPAVDRDVNLEVEESVRWAQIAAVVRGHGGDLLEQLDYRDTYRDDALRRDGRKSVLFSATFRSRDDTLTNEQVDALRDRIVAACQEQLAARLRA